MCLDMINFRMRERSIGKRIRSVYPGASFGFTGRRKTREDRCVESFFQTARSLSGIAWSLVYSMWLGRDSSLLNWEASDNDDCNCGAVETEAAVAAVEASFEVFSKDSSLNVIVVFVASFAWSELSPVAFSAEALATIDVDVAVAACCGRGPLFL